MTCLLSTHVRRMHGRVTPRVVTPHMLFRVDPSVQSITDTISLLISFVSLQFGTTRLLRSPAASALSMSSLSIGCSRAGGELLIPPMRMCLWCRR
jgi:hypothetical protein